MHRILLDHDPLTGVTEHLEFQDEKMRIVRTQDVNAILDQAKLMANDEDYTKRGIKQDQWHYARIPDTVMEEMWTKHHVRWEDKDDRGHKRFLRVLNTHYPAFKTTAWNHE
jgi:hypothetical protein